MSKTKPEAKNAKFVTLTQPLRRGENELTEITLLKPSVLSLKGLKMFDVLQVDVDAYIQLLPRITTPALTKTELQNMDPVDFTVLCTETIGFFVPSEATLEA
ncbi:phage tail assembly protein [Testudinibacter sp. P27/CKL/0425]